MHKLKNFRSLPNLGVLTIIGIADFQYYWLQKAYVREERILERQTNMYFVETVYSLQESKLKLDKAGDTTRTANIYITKDSSGKPIRIIQPLNKKMISMINVVSEKIRDSAMGGLIIKKTGNNLTPDTIKFNKQFPARGDKLMQFVFDFESPQDSITVNEVKTAYAKRLDRENIEVPFTVKRVTPKVTKD